MTYIDTFQRVEQKYLITSRQKDALLKSLGTQMIPDAHGNSTISSLYMDTADFRLIRSSMDARVYKEKLRLRSYGVPGPEDRVFLEIKKKYKGVVYKRREAMTLAQAQAYLDTGTCPVQSQIMREIDYSFHFYGMPTPAMLISYDREAFTLRDHPEIRLTFDRRIRYRSKDLYLEHGNGGKQILPDDMAVLELKSPGWIPIPLAGHLEALSVFPRSYSKYKNAYLDLVRSV